MFKDEPKKIESTYIINLRDHGITLKPGNKSKDDKIVIFGGSAISMLILGKIFLEMCKIQNLLYPHAKGSLYLAEYLDEVKNANAITPQIRTKFKV